MIESAPPGDEKRPIRAQDAEAIQVLFTEHWSLLATRSLSYSESFSRVSMFLAILSGSVIALALVAQAAHGVTFLAIAILMLSIVLLVGLTTFGRLVALNSENIKWVKGMNLLRHAYLERNPDLAPYFIAGSHDDFRGIMTTMGFDRMPGGNLRSVFEGLQTLPGTIAVLVSAVFGALLALVALAFRAPEVVIVLAAAAAFGLSYVLFAEVGRRSFFRLMAGLEARFPTPKEP